MPLVLGCKPEAAKPGLQDIAMQQFEKAGREIGGVGCTGEYHAGFLHSWNNLKEVYEENFERLRAVKEEFDPANRFNDMVDYVGGRIGKREEEL